MFVDFFYNKMCFDYIRLKIERQWMHYLSMVF